MDNLFFYYKELRSLQLGVKSDRSEMELIIEHNGAMQLFWHLHGSFLIPILFCEAFAIQLIKVVL